MKIHELTISTPKDAKRVGRGIGSGRGKTAGRGTKGQNARTGGGVRLGFEGGQNPLAKRLPKKRGFASLSRVHYSIINLGSLEQFKDGATVELEALLAAGLVKKAAQPIKLLGAGQLKKKLTLKIHAASASAKAAVEAAGGSIQIITGPARRSKAGPAPDAGPEAPTTEQDASL